MSDPSEFRAREDVEDNSVEFRLLERYGADPDGGKGPAVW